MVTHRSRPAAAAAIAATVLLAGSLTAPAQALAPPPDDPGGVVEGAGVVTMVPVRIVSEPAVNAGSVRCISVAGANGVPAAAVGVVVNVTTVRPTGAGYAVVYPDTSGEGTTPMPATSTVNFEPGQDVAASTFVELGPNGDLCYATRGGTTGLLMDLSGYVEEGSGVVLAAPQRLLDTRTAGSGGPLEPRGDRLVQVSGRAGVPEIDHDDPNRPRSAILGITVTGASAAGHLRAHNCAQPGDRMTTSVLNYAPGRDKSNTTVTALSDEVLPGVPAGFNGVLCLWSNSDRPVDVVIDVLGWTVFGGSVVSTFPRRALDTRVDAAPGEPVAPLEAGDVLTLGFDEEVVPADAIAVVLNVTAIQPSTVGNLRVFPSDPDALEPPNASSINYIRGRDIPNLVVVRLSGDRSVDLYTDQPDGGTVHVAVDVIGFITP